MRSFMTVGLLCAAFACLQRTHAAEEPSGPAQYEFAYAVNDPVTGDQKDQHEMRNGDDVSGYYRMLEPDGHVRTVRYWADAVRGFQAEVDRKPMSAGLVSAAPAVQKMAVPAVAASVAVPSAVRWGSASAAYPWAGYQAYPYGGYQPYSYGRMWPYSSQYPYNSQYPFSGGYVLRK